MDSKTEEQINKASGRLIMEFRKAKPIK